MRILDASFVAAARDVAQLPAPTFAEIAFAGRSNVGKSSLINALVGQKKLVHTGSKPGATRALAVYRVRVEGDVRVDFVDLPGYGYARRSKAERKSWGPMVEGFLRTRAGLRAVVVIVDARRGLEDDDLELLDFLGHMRLEPVLAVTKIDKLGASKRKPRVAQLGREAGCRAHGVSATDRTGLDPLWHTLADKAAIASARQGSR